MGSGIMVRAGYLLQSWAGGDEIRKGCPEEMPSKLRLEG